MSALPFRGLAEKGVLRDPAPYQLDLNAFSNGRNVRFHANRAERAPIFKTITTVQGVATFAYGVRDATGTDRVLLATNSGSLSLSTGGGAPVDVTATSHVSSYDDETFTATEDGTVIYFNRPSEQPFCLLPGASRFTPMPTWDPSWRCKALRSLGDYLVALNVTEGAVQTTQMVKWSDNALAGLAPDSWNSNDPTKNAGENPLGGLTTPIVDGWPLRDNLVIYSEDQIWLMFPTGDEFVFDFRRLFGDGGLIAANGAVEVAGKHYAFGVDDLYVHDGVTKLSIADKRVRDYIFRYLSTPLRKNCFTSYLPQYKQVLFAYPSTSPDCMFPAGVGCNEGCVYDITDDTFSFIDLPNVYSFSTANVAPGTTFADLTGTFADLTGTFADLDGDAYPHTVAVSSAGGALATSTLLAYDFMTKGRLAYPAAPALNGSGLLERTGIDLDQTGVDLGSYKTVRRIFPLVSTFSGIPVSIQVGSALTTASPISWQPAVTFDPTTQYKVDVRKGGRYLAYRIFTSPDCDFEAAGFDADVIPGGRR